MRVLIFVVTVFAVGALFFWQSPEVLPGSVRAAYAGTVSYFTSAVTTTYGVAFAARQASAASFGAPQIAALPPGWVLLSASLALAAVAAGLIALRGRQSPVSLAPEPDWLVNARAKATETNERRAVLASCDAVRDRVLPDVTARGSAALARAHQLDLYVRAGTRLAETEARGPRARELSARFAEVTREALKAVAIAPEARFLTAYKANANALAKLAEGRESVEGFYEGIGASLYAYERAYAEAEASLARTPLDPFVVLKAMEDLRAINHEICAAASNVIGPIEIKVRARA